MVGPIYPMRLWTRSGILFFKVQVTHSTGATPGCAHVPQTHGEQKRDSEEIYDLDCQGNFSWKNQTAGRASRLGGDWRGGGNQREMAWLYRWDACGTCLQMQVSFHPGRIRQGRELICNGSGISTRVSVYFTYGGWRGLGVLNAPRYVSCGVCCICEKRSFFFVIWFNLSNLCSPPCSSRRAVPWWYSLKPNLKFEYSHTGKTLTFCCMFFYEKLTSLVEHEHSYHQFVAHQSYTVVQHPFYICCTPVTLRLHVRSASVNHPLCLYRTHPWHLCCSPCPLPLYIFSTFPPAFTQSIYIRYASVWNDWRII